jgi:hypothetical protein
MCRIDDLNGAYANELFLNESPLGAPEGAEYIQTATSLGRRAPIRPL